MFIFSRKSSFIFYLNLNILTDVSKQTQDHDHKTVYLLIRNQLLICMSFLFQLLLRNCLYSTCKSTKILLDLLSVFSSIYLQYARCNLIVYLALIHTKQKPSALLSNRHFAFNIYSTLTWNVFPYKIYFTRYDFQLNPEGYIKSSLIFSKKGCTVLWTVLNNILDIYYRLI